MTASCVPDALGGDSDNKKVVEVCCGGYGRRAPKDTSFIKAFSGTASLLYGEFDTGEGDLELFAQLQYLASLTGDDSQGMNRAGCKNMRNAGRGG